LYFANLCRKFKDLEPPPPHVRPSERDRPMSQCETIETQRSKAYQMLNRLDSGIFRVLYQRCGTCVDQETFASRRYWALSMEYAPAPKMGGHAIFFVSGPQRDRDTAILEIIGAFEHYSCSLDEEISY
jgi:hypothetical protein